MRTDIGAQLTELMGDLSAMSAEINAESEQAAQKAALIIRDHQTRIFAKAHFKRDKASHVYKNAGGGLITVTKRKIGKVRTKMLVGFDSETLREYPELLMIEFGRPGKSARHSSSTMKRKGKEVKKGKFPEEAVVMPIRVGFEAAKEQALAVYSEDMLDKTEKLFINNRR